MIDQDHRAAITAAIEAAKLPLGEGKHQKDRLFESHACVGDALPKELVCGAQTLTEWDRRKAPTRVGNWRTGYDVHDTTKPGERRRLAHQARRSNQWCE